MQRQSSDVRKSPELSTFETLLCYIKDRYSFGERKVYSIYNRLKEISPIELRDNKAYFHKSCYAEYGSLSKRNRVKDAYGRVFLVHQKGTISDSRKKLFSLKINS